jgi:regulator of replication initiation timing
MGAISQEEFDGKKEASREDLSVGSEGLSLFFSFIAKLLSNPRNQHRFLGSRKKGKLPAICVRQAKVSKAQGEDYQSMDQKAIGLIAVALILGAVGGYFVGGSQGGGLQAQVTSLTSQVGSLQTQVTSLQSQITTLQGDKTGLQGQVTSLQADKTSLQGQLTSLQTNYSRLATENAALRLNITTTMAELATLRSLHTYTVGSTLTTFSGGYEDKTGPAFHIPAGNVKITAQLTSLGDIRGFYLRLYKVGNSLPTYMGNTEVDGTWTNYVYSLSAGDYYLDVGSINYNWQVTIQVYA